MIMRDNRGFTLVELIATIVIISLILLVAFPSVYKLMKDNDKKEYENYYNLAKEAAYVYADTEKDKLGGSLGSGCIGGEDNEITIDDLINYGFLKEFNKGRIENSDLVIRNNHGKITINLYMEIEGNKFGKKDLDECIAYIPNNDNTLKDVLFASKTSNTLNGNIDNKQYIVGKDPNNYVYYSGKLWRAIQIDEKSEAVKLVTNDVISVIPFDSTSNSFEDSYIENWLNSYFLNSLYNYKQYISTHRWYYSGDNYVQKKVGLVSLSDLNSLKGSNNISYLNGIQYHWTLTKGQTGVNLAEMYQLTSDNSTDDPCGVRPAIYLNPGIKIVDGSGTKTKPYQLDGNRIQSQKDKKLNNRYSGEYVKINNSLYRIVSITNNMTKLVSVDAISFSNMTQDEIKNNTTMSNKIYTLSNIYNYLNETWYNSMDDKVKRSMMTIGDWCLSDDTKVLNFNSCGNDNEDNKSFRIGLIRYGELFASYIGSDNKSFWTLTPLKNEVKMITIGTDGSVEYKDANSTADIKPAFYLNSSTTIKSGSGTQSDPFVL